MIDILVCYADTEKAIGTLEFREVPRPGEFIRIANPAGDWDLYRVSATVHTGIEHRRTEDGMKEPPLIEIYCEFYRSVDID